MGESKYTERLSCLLGRKEEGKGQDTNGFRAKSREVSLAARCAIYQAMTSKLL